MDHHTPPPPLTASADPLQDWRQRTVALTLRALLVVGLPLALFDLQIQLRLGRWLLVAWHLVSLAIVAAIAVAPGLGYRLRGAVLVGLLLLGGLVGLGTLGPQGASLAALALVSVLLALVLLGPRAALATGLLAVLGVGAVFAGFGLGLIPYPPEPPRQMTEAQVLAYTWLLMLGIATILGLLLHSLVGTLQASARSERAARAELARANASLEEAVERRTAEARRAALLLQASQRLAQVGGCACDPAGHTLTWTDELYRIHEVPPGTPVSKELMARLYPGDAWPAVSELFRRVSAEEATQVLEVPAVTLSGRPIWVRVSVAADPGPGGARFFGAMQDITARKEAELALVASEAKYRALFTLLPVGVALADAQGQVLELNPAGEQMLGLRAGDRPGLPYDHPAWEVIGVDGEPIELDQLPILRAARDGQRVPDVEMGVRRADGSRVWLSVTGTPLFEAPYRAIVAYSDITNRKEAERALAAQLRYAEALARCSHILLVEGEQDTTWDVKLRRALAVLRAAVGCGRIALYLYSTVSEMAQTGLLSVADQDPATPPFEDRPIDEADIAEALVATLSRGGWVAGAPEALFVEGSSLRAHLVANQVRQLCLMGLVMGGRWRGHLAASAYRAGWRCDERALQLLRTGLEMIGVFLQHWEATTSLRTREALLHEAQMRQAALLQAIPDLLLGVGASGEVRFAHAPRHLPVALPADVLGRPLAQVLPAELAEVVAATLAHERSAGGDIILTTGSSGSAGDRTLESRVVALGDHERLLIVRDITAQRQLQLDLERARDAAEAAARAKSDFLATMSHEIRTPLNAVIGMAALLQETPLSAEQRRLVEVISTGGQALLAVISDILDFSRIEAGHMALASEPFDLHACLASTIELVAQEAAQKGLALRGEREAGVPRAVVGDAGRLRQVLLNLLGNAVKFTAQGEVTLSAAARPQPDGAVLVRISVRDTGIGMAAEQLGQIFEPFVQADGSTARRYGGTGLGLAICRRLVALMGGSIEVASAPGAGSTFTVSVPLQTTAPEALPSAAAPTSAAARPLEVLIAEDNPVNQEVIRQMLIRLGHRVSVVGDGQDAVDAVARSRFDVVLMDVQMPVLNGEAATRQIRALGPATAQPRIVALTANARSGDRERYLAAGMDDYLSKPVQPADLQRALGLAPPPADEAPAWAAAPLVRWSQVERLTRAHGLDGRAAFAMVLRLFDSELPPQLDAVEAAIAEGDLARLRRAAHRLRGGCRQLGVEALAELCQTLERAEDLPSAAAPAARLRACYLATGQALRAGPLAADG